MKGIFKSSFEEGSRQIKQRVYQRQIHLLYSNQPLGVFATVIVVLLMMVFLNQYTNVPDLLPWPVLFFLVLGTRALATWVYFHQRKTGLADYRRWEAIYFAGVVLTGAIWGGMLLKLFPLLDDPAAQVLMLLTVQGVISVSHNTMGYRRLPYLCYSLLIALPAIYVVYHVGFADPVAIVLLMLIHTGYVLRTANSFYNSFTAMLHLQEESIDREHKLLMQREQASLASQAKTEFLSRMSHELRTPLNAVLGLNELQMLDKSEPLTARQLERSGKIRDAGQHLLSLVNDVLDLSRIEVGSLSLSCEPVDVQQLIRDACKLVETHANERHIGLVFESLPEPVWVMADAQRLKQVLVNLLDNAVKYNRVGGTVTLSLGRTDSDRWRISVIDTGYGISRQGMSELFKPFARLGETQNGIDGIGIGLSFSKQLVEIMQGEIGVESRAGEGSCFWVELPMAEPASSRQPSAVSQMPSLQYDRHVGQIDHRARQGRRLLLVEDNLVNQEVALDMLQEQGFDIDVADNGEEALRLIEHNNYAVVLMDCEMPVMDGLTATRKIREREQRLHLSPTPIIALTAHAVQGAREKCLQSGMDDFLSKPFSYSALHQRLAHWVELPNEEQVAVAEPITESSAQQSGVLDMAALDCLRRRKASLVDKVIGLYLQQSPAVLDEIDRAVADNDCESLAHIVHTFKSSSLTVGAVEVADICRQIEEHCRQGRVDGNSAWLIRDQYRLAEAELRKLTKQETMLS